MTLSTAECSMAVPYPSRRLGASFLPPPRQRGRGTTLRSRVVEGAQDSTRRKSLRDVRTFLLARFLSRREFSATTTKLRLRRPLHHGSLATRAPVVPLPRFAVAEGGGALS